LIGPYQDVVVFTSRDLIAGRNAASNLKFGNRISEPLVEIVKRFSVWLCYSVAKGGITTSGSVTRGLGVWRARVGGQLLPGISVWSFGHEAKSRGLGYIVFPGNVGESSLLAEAVGMKRP